MAWNLKYFDHVKHHIGLETIVMKGYVSWKKRQMPKTWRWRQGIEDTLGMKVNEAGGLATDKQ